jgi:hypothetical protein
MLMLPFVAGCEDEDPVVVDAPPFPPDGVFSVTGDGVVSIFWNPNQESDLQGYRVYRSVANPGPYYLLDGGDVPASRNDYDDFDVVNGETWFYAVTAYDAHGESELSLDTVFDTPRPEGFGLVLVELGQDPTRAGYEFSDLSSVPQPASDGTTDIRYENLGGVNYIVAANVTSVDIQDYGVIPLVEVNYAPETGWAPSKRVEAIVGHSYIVRITDGQGDFNMAKFEVKELTFPTVRIDWAYQAVENELELSRIAPIGGAMR